jgi:hypothetical protein
MTQEKIKEAQEFLTLVNEDRIKRIIDIQMLLTWHPESVVLAFMKNLLREKQKVLKGLIARDKKNPKINETIAAMFRLYMAIKTLEDGKEVKAA